MSATNNAPPSLPVLPGRLPVAPGRLPVASGTAPGMDLGPKLVPKQWVLWFFGPNWCQNSGFYGFLAPSGLKSLRLARTAPKGDWPDGPKITTPSGAGTAPGGAKTVGFIVFGAPGGPGSQKNSGFYRFFGPKRPQEPPLSPETSDQGWAWPPLVSTQQNSWHRFGTTFFQILKISNSLQKKLIGNFWKIFELCNQSQKKL